MTRTCPRKCAGRSTAGTAKYRPYYPNMCYSDKGFIQQVTQRARAYFDTGKLEPGEVGAGDFFSLVPMDSSGQDKFCRCPECQAVLHEEPPCKKWRDHPFFWDDKASDYIFGFVNKVARGVAQTHPGKYLSVAAYHQNYYPPTREPLEPNVAVTFCIHAALRPVPAMDRAVQGAPGQVGRGIARSGPSISGCTFTARARRIRCFRDSWPITWSSRWRTITAAVSRGSLRSRPISRRKSRQEGYAGRAPVVTLLELYLAYKLADDPTLDGNKLIDEFFPLYYGAAGQAMRNLYEALERVYCDPATYASSPANYFGYQTPQIAWKKLGTRQRMLEFGRLMKEAKQAARTEMEKKRVGLFEESIWNRMKKASTAAGGGSFDRMD